MPISAHTPTKKRRQQKASPSKKLLIVPATLIAIGIYALTSHRTPPPTVLGDRSAPLPTSINQNFLDQVNECFLPTAKVFGYTLYVTMGFRSTEEQDQLYAQGRTLPGDVITNAPGGKSLHNFGHAVDVADRIQAYDINWQEIQKIGAYCGLEQGDRGYIDLPHFQYRGGLSLQEFVEGKRPKSLQVPCPKMRTRYLKHQALTKTDLKTCHAPLAKL
jgi:hypothetical protein